MPIETKHYSVQNTPNAVSADRSPTDRSFLLVVGQSGKPRLDYESNLAQDIANHLEKLARQATHPSGWVKSQRRKDSYQDFSFDAPTDLSFLADSFHMRKMLAFVAGIPLVVEYTNTTTQGDNRIQLDAGPLLGGPAPDVKRTDFVFLEAWPALVAPSPHASATVQVANNGAIIAGDTITINGLPLTAVAGAPAVDEFTIGANAIATASNIAIAINDAGNSFVGTVTASSFGTDTVRILADVAGTAGNLLTLATSNGVAFTISGGLFTGGADRPNKPSQDKLYRHGNTDSPLGVALDDDTLDPIINAESSQRIQMQYRIRVTGQTEALNFKSQPDGFSNPSVLAQGGESVPVAGYFFVPADNATVLGNSDASAYCTIDPGLWIAGDGSETAATDLQSLTGFVYAIPLAQVFRRNDAYLGGAGAGFDPVNNTTGALPSTHPGFANPAVGAIAAGTSDRPDGYFYDAIVDDDVLDLRRHIAPAGHSMKSELDFQLKSLLDGQTRTWAIDMSDKQTLGGGSGDVSTHPLVCNEVGRDSGHGGNNVTSGDTNRGVTIRNFDHVARRFGAQPVVERVVFALYSQDRAVGPVVAPGIVNPGKYVVKAAGAPGNVGWFEGDEIHIDLSVQDATTDGTFDPATASWTGAIIDFSPPGTTITDVLSIFHDDGDYNNPVDQSVQPSLITGMGTDHVTITLDANPTAATGGLNVAPYQMVGDAGAGDVGSPRRIFVELEITYPKGTGLTDTPDHPVTPDSMNYSFGPLLENDVTQRPVDMEDPITPKFREGYREVSLEYIASENGGGAPIGTITTETFVSRDTLSLRFLRRIYGSASHMIGVTDQVSTLNRAVNTSTTEYGSSSRLVYLSEVLSGAGHTQAAVTYFAQDPLPNYGGAGGGYQVSVYYRTNAPQTAGVKDGVIYTPGGALPVNLLVESLATATNIWSGQSGPGSVDLPFPYLKPLDQIPVNKGSGLFPGEWYFCATSKIAINDFDADTGLLNLHSFVPVDDTVEFSFGDLANPPEVDAEFRSFYGFADDTGYRPTAMSQPLNGAVRHKVFTGVLARAKEDSLLFRKNELLLIVISRWAELDAKNTITFTDTDNTTSAAVYRTRSLLLIAEDEQP